MNNNLLLDISEMSDSREMLSEQPRRFVRLFVYLLLALIAVALTWSFIGEIDSYVRASGEVRPNDSVSTIRSTFTGRVLESYIEEGVSVQKGDVLFTIDVQNHVESLESLEQQYESIVNKITNFELLRESIITGTNLFDPNDADQTDYYNMYLRYLTDTEAAIEQVRNTNLDVTHLHSDAQITGSTAEENRERAESDLRALQFLLDSMEDEVNLVPEIYAEQHRRYEIFALNIERFESAIAEKTFALGRSETMLAVDIERLNNLIEEKTSTLARMETLYEVDVMRFENAIEEKVAALSRTEALYAVDVKRYESVIDERAAEFNRLENLFEAGAVSRNDRNTAQTELDSAVLELERFKEASQNERSAIQLELDTLRLELDRFKAASQSEREAAQFELDSAVLELERFRQAAQNERDSAQLELDSLRLELRGFISESKLAVTQEIAIAEREIADLDATLRSVDSTLDTVSERGYDIELVSERHKLAMLDSITEALFPLQDSCTTLQQDLISIQMAIGEARISAPITGVVSMFTELSAGDFIQTGAEIATIIPSSTSEHRVMLAVSNADIADIVEGQEINFRFAALPFQDYGEMTGRVTRISTDARSNGDGLSYFLVESEMDGGSLYDRHGVEAQIRVGMAVDARVITKSQKIIHWLLEKLNFMD